MAVTTYIVLAVAKCRLMAILRSDYFGPALTGPSFYRRKNLSGHLRRDIMHLDIILLVILAAIAVWTEADKPWRRRMPQ
jgi:hypothetical protein